MSIQDLDTPTDSAASAAMAPANAQIEAPIAPVDPENGASSQDNPPASASPAKEPKLCGVCNKEPPRYKCPRCLLPYCSLTCSTLHKQTHASDPPPPPKEAAPVLPAPSALTHPGRAGTISGSHARTGGPFAGLETLPELHALFARYPSLPSQLDAILRETLPPNSTNGPTRREPVQGRKGFMRKNNDDERGLPWTHDRGLERGVKALGLARAQSGIEGEAIREFGDLVLRVVERGAGNVGGENERRDGDRNGDEWGGVWREEVEESVKAVERLLKVEDRGMR